MLFMKIIRGFISKSTTKTSLLSDHIKTLSKASTTPRALEVRHEVEVLDDFYDEITAKKKSLQELERRSYHVEQHNRIFHEKAKDIMRSLIKNLETKYYINYLTLRRKYSTAFTPAYHYEKMFTNIDEQRGGLNTMTEISFQDKPISVEQGFKISFRKLFSFMNPSNRKSEAKSKAESSSIESSLQQVK